MLWHSDNKLTIWWMGCCRLVCQSFTHFLCEYWILLSGHDNRTICLPPPQTYNTDHLSASRRRIFFCAFQKCRCRHGSFYLQTWSKIKLKSERRIPIFVFPGSAVIWDKCVSAVSGDCEEEDLTHPLAVFVKALCPASAEWTVCPFKNTTASALYI